MERRERTCWAYSLRIPVWSKGGLKPTVSMNIDTCNIFLISLSIKSELPGCWIFTATFSLDSRSCAKWTCAIVAEAIGRLVNSVNVVCRVMPNWYFNYFCTFRYWVSRQSSNTNFKESTYCFGSKSGFVANTWLT